MRVQVTNYSDHPLSVSGEQFSAVDSLQQPLKSLTPQDVTGIFMRPPMRF